MENGNETMSLKQDSLKGFLKQYAGIETENSLHEYKSLERVKVLKLEWPKEIKKVSVVFNERISQGEIEVPVTYSVESHDDMYYILEETEKDVKFKKYD